MATVASAAIIAAIRAVLEDGAGSVRTIAAGTYAPASVALSDGAAAARALSLPRAEVVLSPAGRAEGSPPRMGSFQLLELDVEIRVTRSWRAEHNVNDDTRDTLKAAAAADEDVIAQALEWPGNLTTGGGNPTGLVSGCLTHESSRVLEPEFDGTAGRLTSVHTFKGIANVATATA